VQSESGESKSLSERRGINLRSLTPSKTAQFAATLTLFNLVWIFTRPQNELRVLASLQVPFIINLFPAIFWLSKIRQSKSRQMNLMILMVLQGALLIPFAVNNFWAFQGCRSLFQVFVGLMFPLMAFASYPHQLIRTWNVCLGVLIYLSYYSITHSGRGPGDYLGDENDLCLALVLFVAMILGRLVAPQPKKRWLLWSSVILLATGGIVITDSRGGFVGFVAVAIYLFIQARQKFVLIVAALLMALTAIAAAPANYWKEISSISQTNEGTAKQRREYWDVAWRIFIDPRNTIWGIGMGNTPYVAGQYEPIENKGAHKKSIAGRQVHSLVFQILPELGLIGTSLFVALIFQTWKGNARAIKSAKRLDRRLSAVNREVVGDDRANISKLQADTRRLIGTFLGLNASLIGVLVSSMFLSVLYYPTIWLPISLSAAAQICWARIDRVVVEAGLQNSTIKESRLALL